jgi:hypothetical protein
MIFSPSSAHFDLKLKTSVAVGAGKEDTSARAVGAEDFWHPERKRSADTAKSVAALQYMHLAETGLDIREKISRLAGDLLRELVLEYSNAAGRNWSNTHGFAVQGVFVTYPLHRKTGRRGYLGNFTSVNERSHR